MVGGWFIGLGGSVSVSVCGVRKKGRRLVSGFSNLSGFLVQYISRSVSM